jgi:hypothetical protein
MKIVMKSIPHNQQRYETCGDWWVDPDGTWQFRTSELQDWRHMTLILVHEFVEFVLCQWAGITVKEVDEFDKAFEAARPDGNVDEPGDASDAPYRRQHCMATGVERILAALLHVNWRDYEDAIYAL